jgi:predicted restriction endonuclease
MKIGSLLCRQPLRNLAACASVHQGHIKPWADCETDGERLDVYNGFLLAAHLDAAFDAALMTFDDDGAIVISPRLSEKAAALLRQDADRVRIAGGHKAYLRHHRARFDGG